MLTSGGDHDRIGDDVSRRSKIRSTAGRKSLVAFTTRHHGAVMKRGIMGATEPSRPASATGDKLRFELVGVRAMCRAWSSTVPEPRRPDLAGLFVRRALEAYCDRSLPRLRLSKPFDQPFGTLDHAAAELARVVGEEVAGLPKVEALHFITSLYPAMLPARTRSDLGAYYTPPCLVERLLDLAEEAGTDWSTARILDPATGAGAFMVQIASRMSSAMDGVEPGIALRSIAARLAGFEIDPIAAGLAQASLEIMLHDLAFAAGQPVACLVEVCDTLAKPPRPNFDLVVGNPPYGRVSLSAEQRQAFSRSLFGHANLYGLFTDTALRWTKRDGHIAFLTPTSFLAGHYFSALRRLLACDAPPVAIDFVHARRGVFEDVIQETMLALYKRGESDMRAQIHYLTVESETEASLIRNGTIGLPADTGGPWLAPRSPQHSALISRVEGMQSRLRDYGYSVSTGPLVWNRFKDQLRYKPGGKQVHPLIWAECVTADGRFIFRASKRGHSPYFKLEPPDEWLRVDVPCVLVQRTTAKEQARRLIAAELSADFIDRHGGVVVENHLNMVRAENVAKVPPGVVTALLNSRVVDEVFRCMSGSVAVSAFELEALPLPDVASLGRLTTLVDQRADGATLAAECARLYGFNEQ